MPLLVPSAQLAPRVFDEPGAELRLLRKAEAVLQRRVDAVLVVLECLQDGHNYCAVLRTMEALGVQNVWLVSPPPMESKNALERRRLAELAESAKRGRVKRWAAQRRDAAWDADAEQDEQHLAFAKGAQRWLSLRSFESTEACVEALRESGREVWVTALEQRAQVLAPGAPWLEQDFPAALPPRLAIVLGAEGAGVSEAFKGAADRLVYLPLSGFAESLNVSVAAALVTQVLLQLYARASAERDARLPAEEASALRAAWYASLARSDEEREAYAGLLASPPGPLDDLRRSDEHRRGRNH